MKRATFLISLSLIFVLSCSRKRNTAIPAIYSNSIKDSFELYVNLPENYSKDSNHYSIAFYMDANLKMGNHIRKKIKLPENKENLRNVIFVGIGHIGSYRKKRRRDFIPPLINDGNLEIGKDPDFGHADKFYAFLTTELIPYINKQYPNNGRYTYIGHSFSGLFGFYCLFSSTTVFKNHVILSPSLWANYSNFFEYEKEYFKHHAELGTNVYHACGTAEWSNNVLVTSRKMNHMLQERNYKGLKYTYVEHKAENHNGVVPVSLDWVFKNVKF